MPTTSSRPSTVAPLVLFVLLALVIVPIRANAMTYDGVFTRVTGTALTRVAPAAIPFGSLLIVPAAIGTVTFGTVLGAYHLANPPTTNSGMAQTACRTSGRTGGDLTTCIVTVKTQLDEGTDPSKVIFPAAPTAAAPAASATRDPAIPDWAPNLSAQQYYEKISSPCHATQGWSCDDVALKAYYQRNKATIDSFAGATKPEMTMSELKAEAKWVCNAEGNYVGCEADYIKYFQENNPGSVSVTQEAQRQVKPAISARVDGSVPSRISPDDVNRIGTSCQFDEGGRTLDKCMRDTIAGYQGGNFDGTDQERVNKYLAQQSASAPTPAGTANTSFYTREQMQEAFDACDSQTYQSSEACKAELSPLFGMTAIGTVNSNDNGAYDYSFDGLRPRTELQQTAVTPAPVRATEFVNGGIYDNGYLVGQRTGSDADLAPTYRTGWGWFDRVVLQIPESTPSAPTPQRAPILQPVSQITTEQFQPVGAQALSAEEIAGGPDSPQPATGWLVRAQDTVSSWFSAAPSPEPPAPEVQIDALRPASDASDYSFDGYRLIDSSLGAELIPQVAEQAVANNGGYLLTPTDIVDLENNSAYERPNYMERIVPDETQNLDYFLGGDTVSPYFQEENDWGSGLPQSGSFLNVAGESSAQPTRQFSQAEPSANPFYNQSLAASVLSALLSQ